MGRVTLSGRRGHRHQPHIEVNDWQYTCEHALAGIDGVLREIPEVGIELKRNEDPNVILNQLYQFSPLQDTFSLIFLALVDGKPRELTLKEIGDSYRLSRERIRQIQEQALCKIRRALEEREAV